MPQPKSKTVLYTTKRDMTDDKIKTLKIQRINWDAIVFTIKMNCEI